jgi:opacity protein-like surface antigen
VTTRLRLRVIIPTFTSTPKTTISFPLFLLNGGGGSGAFYFSKNIGIVAEFEGYGSYTRNINTGAGLVSVSGNLFTYNVGPIVKFRFSRFEPFVETMFGGAHSSFYGNLYNNCGGSCTSTSPSNNAFDFIIGGGVDLPVSPNVAIRPVEFDYLLTRFGNAFTGGNNNQSNFRYQAGLQLRC